ncbi:copper chaperone PCu(A)C [Falsiroseomonas sp. E2-1-a20]|uniref:copper chaperone PCu(A)C n=1 Tax=Falsiroseomonas sp. E2-1-a20 TaxID=3239300 RepID=UPI003F39E003
MARITRRGTLGLLLAASGIAQALAQQAGDLRIEGPWSRAAGAGRTGAGYLTIRNTGREPDRLVSARAGIARAVELHTHLHEGGVMRMRPVPAIDVPAGETVTLGPGGLHLMLLELRAPLNQGEAVPVTLVFERAGEVEVRLAVQSAGARGPAAPHRH